MLSIDLTNAKDATIGLFRTSGTTCSRHNINQLSSSCLMSPSSIFESSWIPGLLGKSFVDTMVYQTNKNTFSVWMLVVSNYMLCKCLSATSNPCLFSFLPRRDQILPFQFATVPNKFTMDNPHSEKQNMSS